MIEASDIKKMERYLRGDSSNDEQKDIYALFSENEGNDEFKLWVKAEFQKHFENEPNVDYDLMPLLDKIHHIIHSNESKRRQKTIHRIYRWYTTTAAVLLIPFLIFGGLWYYKYADKVPVIAEQTVKSTIIAPMGSRIKFYLPDGTIGWLNSGSTLDYSIPFTTNRKIELNGEAWFDVAHDEANPFEISAGKSTIKVLGTKFNLNAYPDENYIEVVLEEGKVSFATPNLSSDVEMKPNERLVLSDGAINIYQEDVSKFGAWKEGKLMFRGDPMAEVARRIERWYNVNVVLADKALEDYVIRGTFQDNSVEEVMKYLSMTSPLKYKIVDQVEHADGSIDKKKILIYAKHIN